MTIVVKAEKSYEYEIDLERATDPRGVLDWIFQIHGKTWGKGCASDLLSAFEDAADCVFGRSAQGVFCPGGDSNPRDRRWEWEAGKIYERQLDGSWTLVFQR